MGLPVRPVGVGTGLRRGRKHGQAQLVSAWLGTYQLLRDGLGDTQMYIQKGEGEVMIPIAGPSPDVLANAATQILTMADLDEQPWFGDIQTGGQDS